MAGLAGEVANLIVNLKLDDSGFTGKMNRVAGTLNRMDSGLSQMGRGVGQVGAGVAKLGTVAAAAAAGGLAAVVTTAASFEQAFTGVEKTVDGTDAQLAELEKTLRGMARTMPVSFEELAGIGEAGGALGIARESLDEFVDVVARLSVSTDLSADAAATSLGQLSNVLHLGEDDLEDFADSLVALGNAGASTESQIVEMAARFGAAGNSAGLSKEEILALSSAVASMGIEVEAGGSSLSRIFGNITTIIGTGSDKINAFLDTMGINAREFRERWEEDALGTFQSFLAELAKLDQFEQAAVLEEAGITGIRDINAVRLMTQNLGFFNDQLDIAQNATGALGTESQKFFDTTAGQWQVLKNNVRDVAATVGTELLPVVNDLIKDFVGALSEPGAQQGIRDFAKDLAEGVRGLVTELKGTDFSGLIGGLKLAAQVAKGAFDAFRALPEPVQQLAIAALVANKVSGGAVGQIAKGLGNIAFGGGKGLAALFGGMRGQSPVNPMFVSVVGPGGLPGAGGPGGGVAAAGKSFLPKGAFGWLGLLGVAAADVVLVKTAVDELAKQQRDVEVAAQFQERVVEARLDTKSLAALTDLRSDLQRELRAGGGDPIADVLKSLFVDQDLKGQIEDVELQIRAATLDAAGGRREMRAQATAENNSVINEFRAASNERMQQNAIIAREAARAASSDMALLSTARTTTERINAQNALTRDVAARVSEQRAATDRGFSSSNAYLGTIAAKDFSPIVNVNTAVHAAFSVTSLQTRVVQQQINTGRSGFQPGLP